MRAFTGADLQRFIQTQDHDCGPSAVAAACWLSGCTVKDARKIARGVKATLQDGSCPMALEAALRSGGMCVQSGEMDTNDLRHHTGHGRAVICPVSEFNGHWVVVSQFEYGVMQAYVQYWCPIEGLGKATEGWFRDRWHDTDRLGKHWKQWGIATWKPL